MTFEIPSFLKLLTYFIYHFKPPCYYVNGLKLTLKKSVGGLTVKVDTEKICRGKSIQQDYESYYFL